MVWPWREGREGARAFELYWQVVALVSSAQEEWMDSEGVVWMVSMIACDRRQGKLSTYGRNGIITVDDVVTGE